MVSNFPPKLRSAPVSNTERQRQFRERNPGYYGRLHRRSNQRGVVFAAAKQAALAAGLVESVAISVACEVALNQTDLLLAIAQAKRPLMLPAPAELLLIPGINAIPTRQQMQAAREQVAVSRES